MKRKIVLWAAVLCLTMALSPAVLAAEPTQAEVCYPTAVTQSEDGTELRKMYDLGPEDDPAGIPRSDFEQDGFHYTLVDVLKQELPKQESRQHTETVSLESKSKDMESVLALLPPEKEFITEDGLSGTLSLQLETVNVEAAGYGTSTREVSATRSYPNLANQDTLADGQHRLPGRLRPGRALHRRGHLHRQRHQQLREGLHGHGGLHRDRQPHRPESGALCGHLRGNAHSAVPHVGGGNAAEF